MEAEALISPRRFLPFLEQPAAVREKRNQRDQLPRSAPRGLLLVSFNSSKDWYIFKHGGSHLDLSISVFLVALGERTSRYTNRNGQSIKARVGNAKAIDYMKQEIHDRIRDIELDRLSGASQLTSKALSVLKFLARTTEKETLEGFLEDFYNTGRRLFEVKPNMAPIQNLVGQIVYEVRTSEERDLISLRDFVVSRIEELCGNSEIAAKKVSEYGAEMINDSDNVITCSYSSTIFKTFKIAKQRGKNFDVLVAESKSGDGRFRYGRVLAGELESNRISTEVFPDDAIYHYASRAEKVLVGADSILADGSLINGIPTYKVALAAKESGVPFYTVCETTKFNVMSYLGRKPKLEEGFDLTPSNLITGIITENGIIEVHEVINLMKEMEKYFLPE